MDNYQLQWMGSINKILNCEEQNNENINELIPYPFIENIINQRNRSLVPYTAPAQGLYLYNRSLYFSRCMSINQILYRIMEKQKTRVGTLI